MLIFEINACDIAIFTKIWYYRHRNTRKVHKNMLFDIRMKRKGIDNMWTMSDNALRTEHSLAVTGFFVNPIFINEHGSIPYQVTDLAGCAFCVYREVED